MKQIEEGLHKVHAEARAAKDVQSSTQKMEVDPVTKEAYESTAMVLVDRVDADSPASKAVRCKIMFNEFCYTILITIGYISNQQVLNPYAFYYTISVNHLVIHAPKLSFIHSVNKLCFVLMTPVLSKDTKCRVRPYALLSMQITKPDIFPKVKWVVSLVTANGHVNFPWGFVWECMGLHTLSISLMGEKYGST